MNVTKIIQTTTYRSHVHFERLVVGVTWPCCVMEACHSNDAALFNYKSIKQVVPCIVII